MQYRPQIDALRAIAVLAVIIFHFSHAYLASGFLGVDMFLVISGYLITKILAQAIHTNTFSLLAFYKARMRRILPALLFFIAIITLVAFLLFAHADFVRVVQSVAHALVFVANVYFSQGQYFDLLAGEKPFLHLWSLSIEEQFYVGYPLLLWVLLRYTRYTGAMLLVCMAFSMVAYLAMPDEYFSLYTRVWALILGAWCATFSAKKFLSSAVVGALVMALVVLFALPESFATWSRLAVCAISALLVCKAPPTGFLTSRPLVMIGLWSYSLYLWHWGILALLRYAYLEYSLPASYQIGALFATVLCALIAYYVVEKPCRRMAISNRAFAMMVAGYALLCASVWAYATTHLAQEPPIVHRITKEVLNLDWDTANTCHDNIKANCQKGAEVAPTLLMVGDSHAGQLNEFVDYVGKQEGFAIDVVSADLCRFFIVTKVRYNQSESCARVAEYAMQNWQKYDGIVYAMYWHDAMHKGDFLQKFALEIEALQKSGKRVYVIEDNPAINGAPFRLLRQYELGLHLHAPISVNVRELDANRQVYALAQKTGAQWVAIAKYIPDDFMVEGYPMYKDRGHLNPYGAKMLGMRFHAHEKMVR